MTRPRRKPRKCLSCGKPLRTAKTGRWYHCDDVCRAQYAENHESDVSTDELLGMRPTDEDNDGVTLGPMSQGGHGNGGTT